MDTNTIPSAHSGDALQNSDDEGVVFKKTTESYSVYSAGRMIPCGLSARLRREFVEDRALAVGARVCFVETRDGTGQIIEVLARRNQLARRSAVPMPGAHAFQQVIAANVDQMVAVFAAAQPAPSWNMLDRYLVTAGRCEMAALICITKLDLAAPDGDLLAEVEEYRRIGYRVLLTSAQTGEGLDELKQALAGRVSALVGKSGVGKSRLLNALQPGLGLRVNAVSQVTGKGRHTTTSVEMFALGFGGAIVDTPGVREFGLWDVDRDELALLFPEIRPLVGRCRFGLDCRHDEEPGCAVRKAVMAGQISPRRYQSYLRLQAEAGLP
jgi:ribosome biogenesis GTPase / thiamine phosphate phosphatase